MNAQWHINSNYLLNFKIRKKLIPDLIVNLNLYKPKEDFFEKTKVAFFILGQLEYVCQISVMYCFSFGQEM